MIEKRRRDRINRCLNELGKTVPMALAKQVTSKAEGTESGAGDPPPPRLAGTQGIWRRRGALLWAPLPGARTLGEPQAASHGPPSALLAARD